MLSRSIACALHVDGIPASIDVAYPGFGLIHGEERQCLIVGTIVAFSETDHMVKACTSDIRACPIGQVRAAAQDDPAVPRFPRAQFELGIRLEFSIDVLRRGRAEPYVAILLGCEAEGAHVRLISIAGGKVPGRHTRKVLDDGLRSVHGHCLSRSGRRSATGSGLLLCSQALAGSAGG